MKEDGKSIKPCFFQTGSERSNHKTILPTVRNRKTNNRKTCRYFGGFNYSPSREITVMICRSGPGQTQSSLRQASSSSHNTSSQTSSQRLKSKGINIQSGTVHDEVVPNFQHGPWAAGEWLYIYLHRNSSTNHLRHGQKDSFLVINGSGDLNVSLEGQLEETIRSRGRGRGTMSFFFLSISYIVL